MTPPYTTQTASARCDTAIATLELGPALADDAASPTRITTVRRVGYRFATH